MKKTLFIFLALILLISGITYADTDGVWTLAKNIRGGTFGSDEQPVTFNYSFINPVFMNRTLTINTSLGRGLWSESNASDGIAGITSATGKSAIYGLAQNSASYSGYFEGGKFEVNQYGGNVLIMKNGNIGIGTATPIAKLDVNGSINAGNIYSNGQLVATQSYVNSQVPSGYSPLDVNMGEDYYGPTQVHSCGGEWGYNVDTCNHDGGNQYICPANVDKTCTDAWGNNGWVDCNHAIWYRTVICKVRTILAKTS